MGKPTINALMGQQILFLMGRLNVGGAEMRTLALLRRMLKEQPNVSVSIFVISGQPGVLDDAFRAAGARIVYGRPGFLGLIRLWKLAREERYTIIHSNVLLASGFYNLVGRLAGIPTRISHLRSTEDPNPSRVQILKEFAYSYLLNRFSTHVVGVCESARLYSRTPEAKWTTLYNGVHLNPDKDITDRQLHTCFNDCDRNIVQLGRVSPEKNQRRSLIVLKTLREHWPNLSFKLHFVGGGSDEAVHKLRQEAINLGVSDNCIFHGEVNNPLDYLESACASILPSHLEGLPGAVIESLSVGTPVVASDLAGVREIASLTTGVSIVSLSEPDTHWARACLSAMTADRSEIKRIFSKSPFVFETHYCGYLALWNVHAEERCT